MTDVDVVLDLYERQIAWYHRELSEMSAELWVWRPDAEANHICLTMWHLARIMDWLVNRALREGTAADEYWHRSGWAEKTGYDPTGLGWYGMGILSGYTLEEATAVPILTPAEMLTYIDESHEDLKAFLSNLPPHGMESMAPGMPEKRTIYFWCQLSLVDLIHHWGEAVAIRAMWERAQRVK